MDNHSISTIDTMLISNFLYTCRCCLASNIELKPIFNSIGSIPQAIFLFTAVMFEENDSLPNTICTVCVDHLNKCIHFKQKVETTDLLLRKYLIDSTKEKGTQRSKDSLKDHDYALPNLISYDVDIESHNGDMFEKDYNKKVPLICLRPEENLFCCNHCGKKFSQKTTFVNHLICHTPIRTSNLNSTSFICSNCLDNFASAKDLVVHSSLHDVSNGFICKSCHKTFSTFYKLKRHVPSHFDEKPFKCQKCEMRFVEIASLTRHFRVHTEQKIEIMHPCSVCQKNFPNRYSLKVHNRSHTGERPWRCSICGKRFTDVRLLNSHRRLHVDAKPYQCEQCNKNFRHRSSLVTHMQTHASKTRPYRCDKCKKAYKQSWSLQIHKRSHVIDKKPFLCEQCSQMFTSSSSLEDHLQWHSKKVESDNSDSTKEPPSEFFQCNECSAQFSSSLDLITHRKLTHALRHECDTCFGKWKTIEELVQHKCDEVLKVSDEPTPDEMIMLPNGEIQDCNTIVNTLLASVAERSPTKQPNKKA